MTTPCQLRMIDPETSETLTRQTPSIPPGLTADDARRIAAAVGASRAENTVKSYTRAFRAFAAWCAQRGVPDLPASPEAIAAYLTERAAAGWRAATVRAARAAISDAHKRAGLEDSASHEGVKRVVAGLAREDTRPQRQAKPLTAEALAAIRATAKLPRKFSGRMEPEDTAQRRGLDGRCPCGHHARLPAPGIRGRPAPLGRRGGPAGRQRPHLRPEVQIGPGRSRVVPLPG